jgi:hypothetical protein
MLTVITLIVVMLNAVKLNGLAPILHPSEHLSRKKEKSF